uniref:Uncharacterized protein n=1 Tax=Cannabis sativa TaxID=3483 RepID=A0A803QQJ4_CANSA
MCRMANAGASNSKKKRVGKNYKGTNIEEELANLKSMSKGLGDWRADMKKASKENIEKYGEEEVNRRSRLNMATSEKQMMHLASAIPEFNIPLMFLIPPIPLFWPRGIGSSSKNSPSHLELDDDDEDDTIVDL